MTKKEQIAAAAAREAAEKDAAAYNAYYEEAEKNAAAYLADKIALEAWFGFLLKNIKKDDV